jgi:hypothetical protein
MARLWFQFTCPYYFSVFFPPLNTPSSLFSEKKKETKLILTKVFLSPFLIYIFHINCDPVLPRLLTPSTYSRKGTTCSTRRVEKTNLQNSKPSASFLRRSKKKRGLERRRNELKVKNGVKNKISSIAQENKLLFGKLQKYCR